LSTYSWPMGYEPDSQNANVGVSPPSTTVNFTGVHALWPIRCGTGGSKPTGGWSCAYGSALSPGCPTVLNSTASNVTCTSFDNTNVIRPGTYDDITIGSNACAWIDPAAAPTGVQTGQVPGVVHIRGTLTLDGGFLFGDGVTIVLDDNATVNVKNGGGFVLNYKDPAGNVWADPKTGAMGPYRTRTTLEADGVTRTTYSFGAWTTTSTSTPGLWGAGVQGTAPTYSDTGLIAGSIGMTFYLRGHATGGGNRFDNSTATMGYLFDGVLYGPNDDIGLGGGHNGQAAAGQIVGWTIKYAGGVAIHQRYTGIKVLGPAYLLEPTLGQR
jgi:hypothetical protein